MVTETPESHQILQMILDRLDDMPTKGDLAALTQQVKINTDKLCEHDHFINGNGSEGAKVRFTRIEETIKKVEEAIRRLDDFTKTVSTVVLEKLVIRLATIFGIPIGLAIILWLVDLVNKAAVHLNPMNTPHP